jgi:hypothetical protein
MSGRTRLAGFIGVAFLAAGCSESVSPARNASDIGIPRFASVGPIAPGSAGIRLDQQNGALGESGTFLIKGFNPTNPHVGDAIVATVYWVGPANIIDSVTDVLTDAFFTPVGNKYTLVEQVSSGNVNMATYVATNVQGFADPNPGDIVLAVRANLHQAVTEGGIKISAWSGVNQLAGFTVGAHRSASGAGSTPTVLGPGSISIGTGALAYAVTMANGVVGSDPPAGFTSIGGSGSDQQLREDGQYQVSTGVTSVDPQWTWNFNAPSNWNASIVALNPPLHLAFTQQPSTTLPLTTIQPPVQVAVLDATGNPATSFTGQVTIAIGHNGGTLVPGTLSGTKTVNVVNGVATFADLSIDQLGNGYTLVVSTAGVVTAESAPFNIGAL